MTARIRSLAPLLAPGVTLVVAAVAHTLLTGRGALMDEHVHRLQIELFLDGEIRVHRWIPMIPGFHTAVASLATLAGDRGLDTLRLVAAPLGLLAVAGAWLLARRVTPERTAERTLQILFLPPLFPLMFLLYTDALAIGLVLLSLHASLRGRPTAAGAAGLAAILVRQTSAVWLAFVVVESLLAGHRGPPGARRLLEHGKRWWLAVLALLGFAAFVVANRGVAIGDPWAHPVRRLGIENLVAGLHLTALVLLPTLPSAWRHLAPRLRTRRGLLLAAATVAAVTVAHLALFRADHPFNDDERILHNDWIRLVAGGVPARVLAMLPTLLGVLLLAGRPLVRRSFLLLYPVAALALLPGWLIEFRYALPALVLVLLLGTPGPRRDEALLVPYLAALSTLLGGLTLAGITFP
jgi:alpha-1,2-glucosyltransferase